MTLQVWRGNRYAGRQRRLFDALDTGLTALHMRALVLDGIQVKRPRCQDAWRNRYANATELADYRRERRAVPRSAPYCRRSGGRSYSPR